MIKIQAEHATALSTRWTLIRLIPNADAIADGPQPSLWSLRTLSAGTVGLRPWYAPRALAAAIPTR